MNKEIASGEGNSGSIESDSTELQDSAKSFDDLANESDPGIVTEFVQFLRYNKKWWLTPILIVMLLLIGAAILLPSPVAPFIYSLF